MVYAEDIVKRLKESSQVVIYGARIVANEVASCLMGAPYYLSIASFMVSDKKGNPSEIMGIPVVDINEGKCKYKDALILTAVLERYVASIMKSLVMEGFSNIIQLTFESDLWSDIRGNYYKALCERQGRNYVALENALDEAAFTDYAEIHSGIYRVQCHVDRELNEDMSAYEWETPIQAGAALTDQIICKVKDNAGENISVKNKEYCELTALYWIWKNDKSRYAGLCHYRRHFNLNRELISRLEHSDIDVVLTIPILNFPNVRAAYAHDHIESDWDIMLEAVKKLSPEYFETADRLQKGVFYYAYNMLIARKNVFDDYCAWLFPILAYCERNCGKKMDKYQNRYIGFLAERLLSVYFLHHEKDYKIVHARKHFIEK